jgi:hypothetical protein
MVEVETVNVTILILPFCIWLMAGLGCATACAQAVIARSVTGQFTARRLQQSVLLPSPSRPIQTPIAGSWAYLLSSRAVPAMGNGEEVTLEPSLLVVSCERLKVLLLDELGLADRWQGRISLTINTSLAEEKGPQLTAIGRPQGWTYELELPRSVPQEILLRSLIQTLLLEIANRQAGVQSAEIPLWLVEGINADLQANNISTFILQPGQQLSASFVWRKGSQTMPPALRQHAPLTFQQLSWPQTSDLTAEGLPVYRSCAQLFLEELLRFDDGRACLRAMIAQLPEHWNWQTAFLLAFHSHFNQLLDVEKWWSVSCVDYVRGDKAQPWSAADCRKKPQSSLDVPVEVRFDAGHMPVDARITLQEAIRQWPPADATTAVQRAVVGLKVLRPMATPEWRLLVELYLKTLLDYLDDSQAAGRERQMGKHEPLLLSGVKAEAIQQLNALDRQREAIWTSTASANLPQLSAVGQLEAKTADVR